ncbi:MAG: hypothetical protein D6702_02195 [Planctomycetota bacterium]|nr:MAG: hypothetical protein D6702_02195 [Planctomycetota bacterium]
MSKPKSKKKPDLAARVQPRAEAGDEIQPKKKNTVLLMGLAIFCLLIFTVTGPMAAVFRQLLAPAEGDIATLVLPSGEDAITVSDYRDADLLIEAQSRLLTGRRAKVEEEDVLAYATLRKLADEMEIYVTDADLRGFIENLTQAYQVDYRTLWRRQGYPNAVSFEENLRNLLRVTTVEQVLAAGAGLVTDQDAIEQWQKDFEEIRYEFVTFPAEDFADEAAALQPTDEELAAFYPDGLSFNQKAELQKEEQLAFDALVVSADALDTPAVQAWAGAVEPSDEDLQGFYDMRKFELYLRPSDHPDFETEPVEPLAEIRDRVLLHYRLNDAALKLLNELTPETDLEAFAAEKGVELVRQTEPVPASQLKDLPRVGSDSLRQLVFAKADEWWDRTIIRDDLAFVARPTVQVQRELPDLAEVRDSVVEYWRQSRQAELAAEAAQAFVDGLPRPEGGGDGSLNLDARTFAEAAAAAGRVVQVQDWISRRIRPAADPKWDPDEKIRPWLRNQIGNDLEGRLEGDVIGPLENSLTQAHVVARLAGRRPPDPATIWPGEMEAARRAARSRAVQDFREQQLSYEGLAQAYRIVKVLPEEGGN